MLVLSRQANESLIIGPHRLTVRAVDESDVTLAARPFASPSDSGFPIEREWILEKNEFMMLASGISVRVVDRRGDKVRLGIECPKEIVIHREEMWQSGLNE